MLPPFTNPGSQNELHLSNQPQIPENGPKSKKQLGLSRPSRRCLYLLASTRPQKLLTTRRRPPPLRLVLHDEPLGWCPQVFSRRLSLIACSRTRPETLETKQRTLDFLRLSQETAIHRILETWLVSATFESVCAWQVASCPA